MKFSKALKKSPGPFSRLSCSYNPSCSLKSHFLCNWNRFHPKPSIQEEKKSFLERYFIELALFVVCGKKSRVSTPVMEGANLIKKPWQRRKTWIINLIPLNSSWLIPPQSQIKTISFQTTLRNMKNKFFICEESLACAWIFLS